MRPEVVTYDTFCQAVQHMQAHGEKLSVRTILSHTGGSFAKIASFLKQWRQEQLLAQAQANHELSSQVKQAILTELGKAVSDTKALYETQLAQAGEQLDEAHEALAKQEKAVADYEDQVKQLNQTLAVIKQLQAQQEDKIQALEKKLEQFMQAAHEADKRAAIAETRCTELEKQLAKQEKERHSLA